MRGATAYTSGSSVSSGSAVGPVRSVNASRTHGHSVTPHTNRTASYTRSSCRRRAAMCTQRSATCPPGRGRAGSTAAAYFSAETRFTAYGSGIGRANGSNRSVSRSTNARGTCSPKAERTAATTAWQGSTGT